MADTTALLMVVTSHDRIDDEHATGVWFEEFAIPYQRFCEQGYEMTVASPRGGAAPVDPRSMPEDKDAAKNKAALEVLGHTLPLREVNVSTFDAVFFPGGHGTMYDMANNPDVARLVGHFADVGKVIASVCHGPAALVGATFADGTPVVKGRRVTAFTNEEEAAVELDKLMPFLLESKLRELGAYVEPHPIWSDHVVVDGKLVTGQNPQSSGSSAEAVIKLLSQ